jgi:hypothetical protein
MKRILLATTLLFPLSALAQFSGGGAFQSSQLGSGLGTINGKVVVVPGTQPGLPADAGDRRFGDSVNVVALGADPTGVADSSGAFISAIATGKTVLVPTGLFHVKQMLALQPDQQMVGMGRIVSQITVGPDFSSTAPGVVELAATETGANIRTLGITFAQSSLQPLRSAFETLAQGCTVDAGANPGTGCMYPPALYAPNASRFGVDHVRISGAWDGLSAPGNPGGFWINDLEVGALDVGVQWDGGLDACHVHGLHIWPFGFNGYTPVYADGTTIGAKIGRCDAQVIQDVLSSEAQVVVTAPATISGLQLDGNGAELIVNQSNASGSLGPVKVSNWQSSKGFPGVPTIQVSAGKLIADNGYMFGGSLSGIPMISVTGGAALLADTIVDTKAINAPVAEVTGGVLALRSLWIDPFALPYGGNGNQQGLTFQAPLVAEVGPGVLDLQGMKLPPIGSGAGVAVQFFSDVVGNVAQDNDFGGWSYLPPSTISAGTYGPNRAPATPITPVASVAIGGAMTPSYFIQTGRATLTDSGYKFDFTLQFTAAAVTNTGATPGVSGQLYIPLPYTLAARSQKAFALGETIGIKLDTNFTQLSAVYDATHNAVMLVESGNTAAVIAQPITTANLTSGGLVSLTVSGDVTAP